MKNGPTIRGGFSFVELLIVITIMGIIATFSISALLAARPHAQLERGELVVTSTLNKARNLAISDELAVRVVIDTANHTMTIEQADPDTTNFTEAFAPMTLPDGVEFVPAGLTFSDNAVRFTPRGSLMSGGAIEISSSNGETTTFTGILATGRFPLSGGNLR